MQGYANWQVPLWVDNNRSKKYFDIPLGSKFEISSPISVNGLWEVSYISKDKVYLGWLEDRYLEYYNQVLPTNVVDIEGLQTPELNDAQQYIIWDGVKQVNLCGELCVAQTLKLPLIDILTKWKSVDPPFYKRIFGAGKATGTVHDDIIRMYGLFGRMAQRINLKKYTPRQLSNLVEQYRGVTVSVHLNTVTGALNGSGVLHWVNVLEVVVERVDMGWVRLYNPYSNGEELYSWREFLATTRQPYGVLA